MGRKVSKYRGISWESHYLKINGPVALLRTGFSDHPWATVLPHGYLLLYMGVFALLGYEGFAITDAMESRIGRVIYWGVKG